MKAKSKSRFRQNKSFLYFINLIGMPTLIVSVALIIIMSFNFVSTKDILNEKASEILPQVAKSSDNKFSTIIDATSLISGNNTLSAALSDEKIFFDINIINELNTFKNTYPFLDNIFIINQEAKMVCDTNGIYSTADYFNSKYKMQNYNTAYWENFRFYNTTDYRILSPTIVSTLNSEKSVIPIVFRRAKKISMKNLIVYSLNLEQLINYDTTKRNSKNNMDIYLLNKYTTEIFMSNGTVLPANYFPPAFYDKLLEETNISFDYRLNNDNKMITVYSSQNTLTGYSYFSLMSKNTIIKQLLSNILISVITVILFLMTAFIAVFKNANHIFMPLNEIYSTLSQQNSKGRSNNILNDIASRTSALITTNQNLSTALTCAQEKYLIDYLNATEHYIDETARNIIKESLHFQNQYFIVVILQLSSTIQLFNKYNSAEYANIQTGFYNIIKDLFSSEFPSFILPSDKETMYIILNVSAQNDSKKVDNILEEINCLLKNDWDYISLSIGKSKVYKGIEGLKLAHRDASNELTLYSVNSNRILFDSQIKADVDFGHREESDLFTALLSKNKENVYELLNIYFNRNKNKSHNTQKQLYINIMNITLQTMELKKINLPNNKTKENIINEFIKMPIPDMQKFMIQFIDNILDSKELQTDCEENPVSGNLGKSIINYIEDNYVFKGLSIDYLANHFHISPSGASIAIKNTLGMNFHEYLTILRVNKAKTLLLTTDEPISNICDECGFSSQQTFYRSFKKVTGQTTTQIRNSRKTQIPTE